MTTLAITRPETGQYAPSHSAYVDAVPDGDVLAMLERQVNDTVALLEGIGEQRSQHRYAPGKWSIREVIGHVIDAERVFAYRALSFARGDRNALPGFEENEWAATSNAHGRSLASLLDELRRVRASTVALFRSFGAAEWARGGTASGHRVTVPALAYVVAGHERHHVRILRERYLTS